MTYYERRSAEIISAKDILMQMGLYSLPDMVLKPEEIGDKTIDDFLGGDNGS